MSNIDEAPLADAKSPERPLPLLIVAVHLMVLGTFALGMAAQALAVWSQPVIAGESSNGFGIGVLFVGYYFEGFAWAPFVAGVGALSLFAGWACLSLRRPALVIASLLAWVAVLPLTVPDGDRQLTNAVLAILAVAVVIAYRRHFQGD